jgi:acyl dehydratase
MSQAAKSLYEVQTFNDVAESDNGIHSDEIAKKFGFEAGLVSGAVLLGHMSYLPVKARGRMWMTNNQIEVRFLQPAYDGEILTIEYTGQGDHGRTECLNVVKTLLVLMTEQTADHPVHSASRMAPARESLPRQQLSWDRLIPETPAPTYFWRPDPDANVALAEQIGDDLPLYRTTGAPVHPFAILRQCNAAVTRAFILPAWIQAGSKVTFHSPLTVSETIEIRMVPLKKWKHKGHEFVTLYILFLVNGEIRVEVEHTAIFKIAPPG